MKLPEIAIFGTPFSSRVAINFAVSNSNAKASFAMISRISPWEKDEEQLIFSSISF